MTDQFEELSYPPKLSVDVEEIRTHPENFKSMTAVVSGTISCCSDPEGRIMKFHELKKLIFLGFIRFKELFLRTTTLTVLFLF